MIFSYKKFLEINKYPQFIIDDMDDIMAVLSFPFNDNEKKIDYCYGYDAALVYFDLTENIDYESLDNIKDRGLPKGWKIIDYTICENIENNNNINGVEKGYVIVFINKYTFMGQYIKKLYEKIQYEKFRLYGGECFSFDCENFNPDVYRIILQKQDLKWNVYIKCKNNQGTFSDFSYDPKHKKYHELRYRYSYVNFYTQEEAFGTICKILYELNIDIKGGIFYHTINKGKI